MTDTQELPYLEILVQSVRNLVQPLPNTRKVQIAQFCQDGVIRSRQMMLLLLFLRQGMRGCCCCGRGC